MINYAQPLNSPEWLRVKRFLMALGAPEPKCFKTGGTTYARFEKDGVETTACVCCDCDGAGWVNKDSPKDKERQRLQDIADRGEYDDADKEML